MRNLLMIAGSALVLGFVAPAIALTTHDATTFTIKIVNVSKADTLKVPGAAAVKAPIAPGVFLVDRGHTLFAPGHPASADLQALAEDGNYEPLQQAAQAMFATRAGMFTPGLKFTITAKPGDRLSFATMFVQSNDKFYGPESGGLALFDADGKPVAGDLTAALRLFDAGTEIDQQPGAGADQAPRQKGPNQGRDQGGFVTEAHDGFTYPALAEVIRIEITPAP